MPQIVRSSRLAGAILSAVLGLSATQTMAAQNCLDLPPSKVGLQLYTFLTHLRPSAGATAASLTDPARLEAVFGVLQQDGWRNVETFGGDLGQPPNSLQCCSAVPNSDSTGSVMKT